MHHSFRTFIIFSAATFSLGACSGSSEPGEGAGGSSGGVSHSGAGGANAAGASAAGASGFGGAPTSYGGAANGGASSMAGGSSGSSAAGSTSGGSGTAGANNSGGTSAGGARAMGGNANGGATSAGGNAGKGGANTAGGMTAAGGTAASAGNTGKGGSAGAAGSTSMGNCSVVPVDPDATQQAKNLLCYLYSIYGNHVLSGQQETSWSNPADDISFYTDNASIGKAPAILGGDFLYKGTGTASQGTTTSRAQAYWAAGGISMIRYHMGAPPNEDSYDNSMLGYSSSQCNAVVTAGTSENTSFRSKLDAMAANLLTLQSAGVPVILALFHETQPNGWFWWSKCSGTQFIALYTYTYNYLMTTKGVHNILRLMPFSGGPSSAYYPGKAMVDLTGGDTYATNPPFTSLYESCRNVAGSTIPLALHETGVIPQPSTMFPSSAPWLLWSVWAGYERSNNSVSTIASAYSSSYTITRDEVPNLK